MTQTEAKIPREHLPRPKINIQDSFGDLSDSEQSEESEFKKLFTRFTNTFTETCSSLKQFKKSLDETKENLNSIRVEMGVPRRPGTPNLPELKSSEKREIPEMSRKLRELEIEAGLSQKDLSVERERSGSPEASSCSLRYLDKTSLRSLDKSPEKSCERSFDKSSDKTPDKEKSTNSFRTFDNPLENCPTFSNLYLLPPSNKELSPKQEDFKSGLQRTYTFGVSFGKEGSSLDQIQDSLKQGLKMVLDQDSVDTKTEQDQSEN